MSALPRWAHGAIPLAEGGVEFRVWAPRPGDVSLRLNPRADSVDIPLELEEGGWRKARVASACAGDNYFLVLDGEVERPDPASRSQPEGVHGPSRVVAAAKRKWTDASWRGIAKADIVLYELHVGTFTQAGTFSGIVDHFPRLRDLGINAIELMPIGEFPGARNWGYDGVFPYAPQSSYGGPDGLHALVDAAHAEGIAVFLDVVYNHVGPEGNILHDFAPYFTETYRTPWGDAMNFDGPDSDAVRSYVIENALQWIVDYHIDGLRLDAVHAICDLSARPILRELAEAFHALGRELRREIYLIAESDRNDPTLIRNAEQGGMMLDGVWNDDFHHAVHSALTGEHSGYYVDFGAIGQVAKAFERRFIYDGCPSQFRRRRHGADASDVPAERFVVFVQNHDQVGNRARGERLSSLVSPARLRLGAAFVLLAPYIPLLFMGEEYGEIAPFLYFVDHQSVELREAVRTGRTLEFASFGWTGDVPDPCLGSTFDQSRLNHGRRRDPKHAAIETLYAELLRLRRTLPGLRPGAASIRTCFDENEKWLAVRYDAQGSSPLLAGWNLANVPRRVGGVEIADNLRLLLSTDEPRFAEPGATTSPRGMADEPILAPETARLWMMEGGS